MVVGSLILIITGHVGTQGRKGNRRMPRHKEAKKDVKICEKLRGVDNKR